MQLKKHQRTTSVAVKLQLFYWCDKEQIPYKG